MTLKKPDNWVVPDRYGDPKFPTHPEKGYRICAAFAQRENKFGEHVCLVPPIAGMTRCRKHGGATPVGIAAPNYQGKGFSTHMGEHVPARLKKGFEAALSDPELLSLTPTIALLDSRMDELLDKLDTGESGQLWRDLRATADAMEAARDAGDIGEVARLVTQMVATIRRGAADWLRWREIYEVADRRRKQVETMRKYRRDNMRFITEAQMIMSVHQLASIIQQNVADPQALKTISRGIELMMLKLGSGDDAG